MPRVIGIDPGTISIDLCGLDDSAVFLDRSLSTADALADPAVVVGILEEANRVRPIDLVAGPSGYGLPLTHASDLTDADLRLAYLAAPGERGGIGGLGKLMRALAQSSLPVVMTPGVVHLASVPTHRKVNRIDMGTADKVCAAALAIHQEAARRGCAVGEVSLILLEMGGAFTAAIAVEGGRIVDGVGGSSGPLGIRAVGALDGEVAYLAGTVSKQMLFAGGASTIAGTPTATPEAIAHPDTPRGRIAWEAYLESAIKAVMALVTVAPAARDVIVSGRLTAVAGVVDDLRTRLVARALGVRVLTGFARVAKSAAQGAALIADGLAGGRASPLVETLGIREASGTVLDHLHVIDRRAALARLGLT